MAKGHQCYEVNSTVAVCSAWPLALMNAMFMSAGDRLVRRKPGSLDEKSVPVIFPVERGLLPAPDVK